MKWLASKTHIIKVLKGEYRRFDLESSFLPLPLQVSSSFHTSALVGKDKQQLLPPRSPNPPFQSTKYFQEFKKEIPDGIGQYSCAVKVLKASACFLL